MPLLKKKARGPSKDPPAFEKGQGVLPDDTVFPAERWDLPEENCPMV